MGTRAMISGRGGAGRLGRGGETEASDARFAPAAAAATFDSDVRERRLRDAIAPVLTTCCRVLSARREYRENQPESIVG